MARAEVTLTEAVSHSSGVTGKTFRKGQTMELSDEAHIAYYKRAGVFSVKDLPEKVSAKTERSSHPSLKDLPEKSSSAKTERSSHPSLKDLREKRPAKMKATKSDDGEE